jgi:hypothetical protein
MLTENAVEQHRAYSSETEITIVPEADKVSLETIVNLLVNKGVFTTEEIFTLESKIRNGDHSKQDITFVNIKNPYNRGKFPGLKKQMSKRRWSRRVGTWLFGWKWKKIKKNPAYH